MRLGTDLVSQRAGNSGSIWTGMPTPVLADTLSGNLFHFRDAAYFRRAPSHGGESDEAVTRAMPGSQSRLPKIKTRCVRRKLTEVRFVTHVCSCYVLQWCRVARVAIPEG